MHGTIDPLANALMAHHKERAGANVYKMFLPVPVGPIRDHSPDYGKIKAAHKAMHRVCFLPVKPVVDSIRGAVNGCSFREPTVRLILSEVSKFYRTPVNALLSHRRTATIVRPRQIAMYLARELTTQSLPQIALFIGKRDHTTVMHACQKIGGLMQTDDRLADELAVLKLRIMDVLQ